MPVASYAEEAIFAAVTMITRKANATTKVVKSWITDAFAYFLSATSMAVTIRLI
jgi:hypothetical protein